MIKKIRIYDMDGTFINSLHRYQTDETGKCIDLNHWISNDTPEKIAQDSFLDLIKWVREDLKRNDTYVIYATARACTQNDANYKFLWDNALFPDKFVHRQGRDDTRGGAELKISAIKPLLNLKQFKNATVHVFEDNISYLTDMVHALGNNHPIVGHYIPSMQGH